MVDHAVKCSVIIPCLNEAQNLPGTLDAVFSQDFPRNQFEVIVVDGGSEDGSPAIAEERGATVLKTDRGVSRQRNAGATAAAGGYLVFLDGDCVPAPGWLATGIGHLEEGGFPLAGGPIRSDESPGWAGRAWDVHTSTRAARLMDEPDEFFRLITTANLFVTREAFQLIGGFDEELTSGEDFFFCFQVQKRFGKMMFDRAVSVQHLGQPDTVSSFFREQVWHSNTEVWRRLRLDETGSVGQAAYRFGILTLALSLGVAVGAVASLLLSSAWPILISLVLFLGLPMSASAQTCIRARSLAWFLPLAALYLVFGVARGAHILGLSRPAYWRKGKSRD